METQQELQRMMATAEELHSIVRTMKTLSSTTIRQYERAASAIGEYVHTVELAFRVLLRDTPVADPPDAEPEGPVGLIVFGTDRGFCGPFNRDIARVALGWRPGRHVGRVERRVICMGLRVAPEFELHGERPDVVSRMPGSVDGIVGSVQELLLELDAWREQGVERVVLFHHRPLEVGHEPVVTQLIPLDPDRLRDLIRSAWPTRVIPMSFMEPRALIAALTRELLFASLYRTHAESLASEHAARLEAMRAAEQTIEERLGELEQRYNQVRQAVITEELLDLTSGFEALSQDDA